MADKIRVVLTEGEQFHSSVSFYVNGKLLLTEASNASTWGVRALNFDNGRTALYFIWGMGSRMCEYHGLYDFPDCKKMRTLVDFYQMYPIA